MTDSTVSDQNRTVLSGRCLDSVMWNGHDPWRPFSLQFLEDLFQIASISVGSHYGESGRCWDIFGTDSERIGRFLPCESYKSDQNRIENGIIGTNSAGNG